MLRWIGERHEDPRLLEAAARIERAVQTTLAQRRYIPRDLGGMASCTEVTQAVCDNLN
jgi:3-isopropylmalate dehydrogenase